MLTSITSLLHTKLHQPNPRQKPYWAVKFVLIIIIFFCDDCWPWNLTFSSLHSDFKHIFHLLFTFCPFCWEILRHSDFWPWTARPTPSRTQHSLKCCCFVLRVLAAEWLWHQPRIALQEELEPSRISTLKTNVCPWWKTLLTSSWACF